MSAAFRGSIHKLGIIMRDVGHIARRHIPRSWLLEASWPSLSLVFMDVAASGPGRLAGAGSLCGGLELDDFALLQLDLALYLP